MKMKTLILFISVFIPCSAAAQEVSPDERGTASWRMAESYASQAENSDTRQVMSLINGTGQSKSASWACASCHGKAGEGTLSIPRLAGISAGYIVKQLHDFQRGTRLNGSMQYVVSKLKDEEMTALGAYYASLETAPSAKASLDGDLERGRTLALAGDWSVNLPACFSCHGSLGWGVDATFPALAGQHPAYIHAQLMNWKNGRRANSPLCLMHSVAQSLSEKDVRAVSDYLATLPPPQPHKSGRR